MVIFQNRLKSEIWGEIWVAHVLKATEGIEVLGESEGFFSVYLLKDSSAFYLLSCRQVPPLIPGCPGR